MLRGGYTSVNESYDLFEEIPLRNTLNKNNDKNDDEDELSNGCFCSFTRIIRLLIPRKLFSTK
jgi:hypothetical protein